ncbi:unnamed protein product [Sphenostylis stenocarpa]|uniref:Saposin B-type domain-containing protein n=1 Tax=Sphenostylis stenocarpa TaxID=92480 RepID=A0AA86RLW4_9FABA|nr:unnamed protein product [Sphenostylis stenocarpa]
MALLFLVVLGAAWACDARELVKRDQLSKLSRKPDVCALCEEYTAKALDYLNDKKTQQEIIDVLHNTCHQIHSFNQKCITLVDYYAPLFFLEIATIQPGEFCHKINLCHLISYISLQVQEDSCGFYKDTVSTLLAKLKDSDTKLEIIDTTLNVCNSVEKYASKCTRMVLEYGALVFDNAEKFLESTDMCTTIYALQMFNSGWPTSLSLRLLWKQQYNTFHRHIFGIVGDWIRTFEISYRRLRKWVQFQQIRSRAQNGVTEIARIQEITRHEGARTVLHITHSNFVYVVIDFMDSVFARKQSQESCVVLAMQLVPLVAAVRRVTAESKGVTNVGNVAAGGSRTIGNERRGGSGDTSARNSSPLSAATLDSAQFCASLQLTYITYLTVKTLLFHALFLNDGGTDISG